MKAPALYLSLLAVAALVLPTGSAQADTVRQAAGCTYKYTMVSENQAVVVHETADGKRFLVDVFLQLANTSTPGCTDMLRNAVTFHGTWNGSPANMGARGRLWVDNEYGTNLGDVAYVFYSTGPTGTTSRYSAWTPRNSCHVYTPVAGVGEVSMGGVVYDLTWPDNTVVGEDYPYCLAVAS